MKTIQEMLWATSNGRILQQAVTTAVINVTLEWFTDGEYVRTLIFAATIFGPQIAILEWLIARMEDRLAVA
jgi:hypothetical protein